MFWDPNEVIQGGADQIKCVMLGLLAIIQQARHKETHLEGVDQTVQSEGDRDQQIDWWRYK